MYYLFIILSLLFKYNLCQNNLINSKLILDDFQPFASSFEERPVWNYESIDGKEEDAIIEPGELEENSDDLNDSELKNSNKQSIRALNNNENTNEEQIQIEQPNLQNLFDMEDNEYINQYRSLGNENGDIIESNIESNPFQLLLQQKPKKNPRETRPYTPRGLRNSYVNFIKDDEFDDFDGNYDKIKLKLNESNKQLNNKTNEKIMKLNNDNKDNKINNNKINRKNKFYDENDYEDRFKEKDNDDKINYENFENLAFKLDDDEDEKKINDKKLNNQNNDQNNEKNKSYQALLTKDIIPIPKSKSDLISKVIYSDKDDQKRTENQKQEKENNLKTVAISKEKFNQPTEYIDQPSLEPRIKKLRRIRRLRKQRFNQQPVDIKERIKNDMDKNFKNIKSENFTDNKINNDKIAADELNKLNKESDKFIKQNINQSKPIHFDKTININDSNPNDNKKSNRVIRVVKFVKTNPLTKEIEESNVTVINKTLIKNETKDNQVIKEKFEPKTDLNKTNKIDAKIKLNQPIKNEKLTNYSNVDDYIDEFEDVESKKSKIKRVLYLN